MCDNHELSSRSLQVFFFFFFFFLFSPLLELRKAQTKSSTEHKTTNCTGISSHAPLSSSSGRAAVASCVRFAFFFFFFLFVFSLQLPTFTVDLEAGPVKYARRCREINRVCSFVPSRLSCERSCVWTGGAALGSTRGRSGR